MINTNPDTEDRLHVISKDSNPNPNADRQEPQNPTHDKIINSAFTSFEEVRAKHQTAQSNFMKNQLRRGFFKC